MALIGDFFGQGAESKVTRYAVDLARSNRYGLQPADSRRIEAFIRACLGEADVFDMEAAKHSGLIPYAIAIDMVGRMGLTDAEIDLRVIKAEGNA